MKDWIMNNRNFVVAFAASLLQLYSWHPSAYGEASKSVHLQQDIPVTARACDIQPRVVVFGKVMPEQVSVIQTDWPVTVERVLVREGSIVRRGQLLAVANADDYVSNLSLYQNFRNLYEIQLESLTGELASQQKRRRNLRALAKKGIASESELETLENRILQLQASQKQMLKGISEINKGIAENKTQVDSMNFLSPQDGIVTQVLFDGKEAAFPAQSSPVTPIVTVASLGRYLAQIEVPQSIDRKLHLGSNARVILPDGSSMNGKLIFSGIVPKITAKPNEQSDKSTRPAQYSATFAFEYKLGALPKGVLVEVNLEDAKVHRANVCVPWNAISSSDGADWVHKLVEGDDWRKTRVKLGMRSDELVEVLDGVSLHEPVKSKLW